MERVTFMFCVQLKCTLFTIKRSKVLMNVSLVKPTTTKELYYTENTIFHSLLPPRKRQHVTNARKHEEK